MLIPDDAPPFLITLGFDPATFDRLDADPDFANPSPKIPQRRGNPLIVWVWILAFVGILIALLLPATRSSRGALWRMQCATNFRQIALALRNYEVHCGAMPPARTVDASGRPLHSWRTLILPFLNSEDIYRQIDLAKPWDDPANAEAAGAMPAVFRCPATSGPPNTTNYLAIVGPHACFLSDKPRRLAEITNDHSSTLMLIEASSKLTVPWMAPRDANEFSLPDIVAHAGTGHPGGRNAAFVDGSVRFLFTTQVAEIREMIAISGSERKTRQAEEPPSGPVPGGADPGMPR